MHDARGDTLADGASSQVAGPPKLLMMWKYARACVRGVRQHREMHAADAAHITSGDTRAASRSPRTWQSKLVADFVMQFAVLREI